ncbi:methyl-accepting chemotaxis protein [Radiobacillus kanasensis]|uniref:methyl-accepting chemotaxis protein n=1 Tax=Radiobacillus kanasensis TaxID=2844358 RepID=UPI001E3BDB82|nr:methyl-accepting chemotaxis protein [Radiobacillus kanasensis]UFT99057.1 methyl-accepting chemotaxis protein [Radiobacillus kanasensis]
MGMGRFLYVRSLRVKIIVVCLLLLAVPSLVIGMIGYETSKKDLNELGEVNLQNNVKMAVKLANSLYNQVEEGDLTEEEAQERLKVALLGELQEDGTRPIDPAINIGENGYFFVIDEEGTLLAHPNSEGSNLWGKEDPNGVNVGKVIVESALEGNGFSYYDWPLPTNPDAIEPKVTYAEQEENWGWIISAGTYMVDFNAGANRLLSVMGISIGVALLIGALLVWFISGRITKPIINVSNRMEEIANGELHHEPLIVNTKDETKTLTDALNHLQSNLRSIIENVSVASKQVTEQSEWLTQTSDQVKESSNQVAATMQELSSGSEAQATNASNLAHVMGQFTTKVSNAHENGQAVSSTSSHVLKMAEDGTELMDQSVDQMQNIYEKVSEAVNRVDDLSGDTKEITKLIEVIQGVAEQTNLLALNAAIEAARAGEQGKGFAVVANEVRKLAEQVSKSVGEITDIVKRITNSSDYVVHSLSKSYEEVEEGTEQIQLTRKTFDQIKHSVLEMVENSKRISTDLQVITSNSNEMSQAIDSIAAVAEESAAGIEQTAASAQQSNSSVEEVTESAKRLDALSKDLDKHMKKFQL